MDKQNGITATPTFKHEYVIRKRVEIYITSDIARDQIRELIDGPETSDAIKMANSLSVRKVMHKVKYTWLKYGINYYDCINERINQTADNKEELDTIAEKTVRRLFPRFFEESVPFSKV